MTGHTERLAGDLGWCGFGWDGPCPDLEMCSVHALAAELEAAAERETRLKAAIRSAVPDPIAQDLIDRALSVSVSEGASE